MISINIITHQQLGRNSWLQDGRPGVGKVWTTSNVAVRHQTQSRPTLLLCHTMNPNASWFSFITHILACALHQSFIGRLAMWNHGNLHSVPHAQCWPFQSFHSPDSQSMTELSLGCSTCCPLGPVCPLGCRGPHGPAPSDLHAPFRSKRPQNGS